MQHKNANALIGETPLIPWGLYGKARILVKDEGRNLTGSIKDRTMQALVENLGERGLLENRILLDTSSGSAATALAVQAALRGLPARVAVNKKISATNRAFLDRLKVEIIDRDPETNEPFAVTGDGYAYCKKLVEREPERWAFTDQLNNPVAVDAHYYGTAMEILRDAPEAAAVVGSIGSGAHMLGISRRFREANHAARLFGAVGIPGDVAKVAGTFREDADYVSPFIAELLASNSVVRMPVRYQVAMDNVWKYLVPRGIEVGPQGGGVLQAAFDAIDQYGIEGDVVVIAGDSLLKNMDRYTG